MNIVILDGYTLNPGDLSWEGLKELGSLTVYDRTSPDELVLRCSEADVILTNKAPISRSDLEQLPNLKYIGILATGFNIVDIQAAKERGIPVCNAPGYSRDSVAQLVLSFMLHFASSVNTHDQRVHCGDWVNSPDFSFTCAPLFELSGKTLGIIGLGDIGKSVAKLALAFGMKVLGHSRTPKNIDGIRDVSLNELLEDSDFITLHCPLTDDTKNLIDAKALELMKNSAYLINTSRGPTIHEQDLADALNGDKIAGAGLDVLSSEPPASDHPLLSAKNCVITPHIAWATFEARQRLMAITVDNLRSFMAGSVKNVANP